MVVDDFLLQHEHYGSQWQNHYLDLSLLDCTNQHFHVIYFIYILLSSQWAPRVTYISLLFSILPSQLPCQIG